MNGNKMKTPPGFPSRASYAKVRVSAAETSGSRPEPSISMHALSGHLAVEVPIEPLLLTSVLLAGTPTRNKTRPSHFQKWAKKFYVIGDLHNHLASFIK